jgi:peptidoglycan/LPS O-acetylase OafA/YrhL
MGNGRAGFINPNWMFYASLLFSVFFSITRSTCSIWHLAPSLLVYKFGIIFQTFTTSLSTAVSLFFFLSSYLITGLLDAELQSTGKIHIKAFYVRRILRIWPLYYAFFGFCVVFGLIFSHYRIGKDALIAFTVFAGNWYFVLHGWAAASRSYDLLWSVSIEEQFYLVCPFMVKFFTKRPDRFSYSLDRWVIRSSLLAWLDGTRRRFIDQAEYIGTDAVFFCRHAGGAIHARQNNSYSAGLSSAASRIRYDFLVRREVLV